MATYWITALCMAILYTVVNAQVTCPAGLHVSFTGETAKRLISTDEDLVFSYDDIEDAMACFNLCKQLTTCEAFNYNRGGVQCEVLQTDDRDKIQEASRWSYNQMTCSTTEPSADPTSEPEAEGEPEITAADIYAYMRSHPEYVAMIGMGLVILLLFITSIVILCCYSGGSSRRSDKYREKA